MFSEVTPSAPFRWQNRPEQLQKRIDTTFETLSQNTYSSWRAYNGQDTYGMLTISEGKCFKAIINQLPAEETNAYGVDIGCGNFQLVRRMVQYMNAQTDIRSDMTVHVIGIRGEGGEERIERIGRCILYELTAVKIENIFDEFMRKGIFKIHFGISRWTIRHFNDSVGTWVQIYNLLAKKGIFIFDGFFFLSNQETVGDIAWLNVANSKMLDLVVRMHVPFLMERYDRESSLNQFILQRSEDVPCQLDMKYLENFETSQGKDYCIQSDLYVGSDCITRFNTGNRLSFAEYFKLPDYNDPFKSLRRLCGDKGLYDWLRENKLIDLDRGWCGTPIEKEKRFKLHQQVHSGSVRGIEECLARGENIDEVDSNGFTALHIAMKEEKIDCFNFLLERGANPTITSCLIEYWQWESSNKDVRGIETHDLTLLFEAKEANYKEEYIRILENLEHS